MAYIASFLIGFTFGVIPFSYMIGSLRGIDITKVGSRNIGAANLGRNLGFAFFIFGLVLDAAKGIAPVLISRSLFGVGTLAGAGAILGHVFNPLFGFHGGKGVATTIGVALALMTKSFTLALGLWLIVYLTTFLVSLASLCFSLALPAISIILQEGTVGDRILFILVAIVVIYAHRSNIGRLLNRKEPKTVFWRRG